MKRISLLPILMLALSFSFYSCSDDDDGSGNLPPVMNNTIADVVIANENYSVLEAALIKTDLVSTFQGSSEYTVFAPNNQAFQDFLSDNGFASLDEVPTDVLTQVLLYHVVPGNLQAADLQTQYYSTLSLEEDSQAYLSLYADTSSGVELNGATAVITPNIEADNGVIHGIETVLSLPTVADLAIYNDNFNTLVTALGNGGNTTDFLGLASDPSADITVFAPTNDAFDTFLNDLGVTLPDVSGAVLDNLLRNHVVARSVASTQLSTMYVNTEATFDATSNKLSMYINTENGVTLNGQSNVILADVVGVNGIIHAVDAVVGLPTIVTFATADSTFESLVSALTRETSFTYVDLLNTENGTSPAPFTVFAPTNDAFADLLTELGASSLADIDAATLEATLNMHVITGTNVTASDLTSGAVTTAGGEMITIDASNATITDPNSRVSNIIVTDVQASNGVIHAIDKVILPALP